MKKLSFVLVAAGLVSLAACSKPADNTAATNAMDANAMAMDNGANAMADTNAMDANAMGNTAENATNATEATNAAGNETNATNAM